MPQTNAPGQPPFKSPFVARLVANAMLDELMQWMHDSGIVASLATMTALQALRRDIDARVARAGASLLAAAGTEPSVDELLAASDRLAWLRRTMASGPPDRPDAAG